MSGVKKLQNFYKSISTLVCLILLTACNASNTADISAVLDARNTATNEKNIAAYADILINDYNQHGRTKEDVLLQMFDLFKGFQTIQMQTHNRHINIIDDNHALCEQSYTLKVMADNEWRSMVQQEQLQLIKQGDVWKINGGL
ncbi:MAG: hypothetical protein Q9M14_07180 [Mariprofundaceae bacterium]|nr:hypothetical protein [Mariprofundaceae bacterium]